MAYTAADYIRATAAAEKAGDSEAAAYLRGLAQQAQASEDRATYNPTAGQSGTDNFWSGVGQGMYNVARHAGNLVGVVSDEDIADAKQRDAALLDTTGGKIGSFVGESAAYAPLGMGVAGAVGRAGQAGARLVGNTIGRGVTEGAAQGALMADPGERGAGAILGGAVGGALPAAFQGYKGITRGVAPTKEAAYLMSRGVDLSPGQMNPNSALGQIEESARALPIVGQVVDAARNRGSDQFRRLVAEESLAPGARLRTNSSDPVDLAADVYQGFGQAYAPGKGYPVGAKIMSATGPDVPLTKAFDAVGKKARTGLLEPERLNAVAVAKGQLNEVIKQARQGGGLDSADLLNLRSMIREQVRAADTTSMAGRATRDLYRDIEARITQALESQLPPDAIKAIRAADAQYGKYKVLEDATSRGGTKVTGMTAYDLAQAVKQSTPKGSYARGGGGDMRQLADAGVETFTARQPMTGRQAVTLGAPIAALTAAGGAPAVAAAGAGLAGLIGTQTGRRIAAGRTKAQQLARALERSGKQASTKDQRQVAARLARALAVSTQTD